MSAGAKPAKGGFLRDSILQFGGSLGAVVIGFATSVCLARGLDPEAYGAYSLGISFAAAAAAFGSLGWGSASIYRLRKRNAPPPEVFSAAIAAAFAGSLTVIGLGFVARAPIYHFFFAGAPPAVFAWALVLAPAQVFGMVPMGVALGLDRFALSFLYRLGAALIALLAVVALLTLKGGSSSAVLGATAVAYGVAAIVLTLAIGRRTGVTFSLPIEGVRESASFGMKSWVQMMATAGHEQAGAWILAAMSRDPVQVAYYTLALGVVNRLRLVPDALGTALFPHVASLEDREAARVTALVLRHTLVWSFVAAAGLGLVGIWLVPLIFGAAYAASVPTFLLLLPTTLASTAFLVVARYFQSVARQEINIRMQLAAVVANVVFGIALSGQYGSEGAAVAALASYAILGGYCLFALARAAEIPLRNVLRFRAGEAALYQRAWQAVLSRTRAA